MNEIKELKMIYLLKSYNKLIEKKVDEYYKKFNELLNK